MSEETKEGKKNRKRPLKPPKDEFALPNISPMYLLTFIGVIIAEVSPYYTRKTAMKEEEAKERVENSPEPKDSVSTRHEAPRSEKDSAQRKQGIKGPDHMNQFYAQRHRNTGIFTFDD